MSVIVFDHLKYLSIIIVFLFEISDIVNHSAHLSQIRLNFHI